MAYVKIFWFSQKGDWTWLENVILSFLIIGAARNEGYTKHELCIKEQPFPYLGKAGISCSDRWSERMLFGMDYYHAVEKLQILFL